jgi:hypothetical protein
LIAKVFLSMLQSGRPGRMSSALAVMSITCCRLDDAKLGSFNTWGWQRFRHHGNRRNPSGRPSADRMTIQTNQAAPTATTTAD